MRGRFLGLCVAFLLAFLPLLFAADGPPFWDRNRSVENQKDAAKEAVAVVKKGAREAAAIIELLADPSGLVRDAVFKELLRWTEDDLVRLAPGLGARDVTAPSNLAEIFGRKKVAGAREGLERALRSQRDARVLLYAVTALGEIGSPDSMRPIEQFMRQAKDPHVSAACLIALAGLDAGGAVARLEEAARDGEPPLRIAAMARLAELDPVRAARAAVLLLKSKVPSRHAAWEPRLLFQALDTLMGIEDRGGAASEIRAAIEVLIPRIDKEDGRLQHEIVETLRTLTGQWDIADDTASWESWWHAARETFDPAAVKKETNKEGGSKRTVVRYFGIPIYSKRLTFLLDLSGGMDRPIIQGNPETPRRVDFAKQELGKVLGELEDDVMVNVVFFASEYSQAAKQLVQLRRGRKALQEFVKRQEIPDAVHTNRGNLFDPLLISLEDPDVDTVFLLTEGNPTEGLYQDRDRFVHHLKIFNRLAKTRVHTLFIGSAPSAKRYCEAIAQATGGSFYDADEIMKRRGE